jgi:hypothetical protein
MLALPERHQSRPFWQYAAERGDRASVTLSFALRGNPNLRGISKNIYLHSDHGYARLLNVCLLPDLGADYAPSKPSYRKRGEGVMATNESDEVDEFTGYRIDEQAKPLSRSAVWIRASVGLVTLILIAIVHKDGMAQIAYGLYRFLKSSVAAFSG